MNEPAGPASGQPWWRLLRWYFVVLLAVIVFFGAIRWRLLDMPLERDEGEYAYAGQLILQGIPPYQLAYNMKLPGTYAAYAAILATFGQTARGIHLGLLLVNAVSVILLYVITARLFGALPGIIAAASYALLSTHQGVLGFAAHATHFIVLAALIGIIMLLRAEETGRTAHFFGSGLAFGIAFLMKQPGILLAAFAACYIAVRFRPKNEGEWVPWAKRVSVFLLGGMLPFVLTCALLYRTGAFQNFWFWTFVYARQYGTIIPPRLGLEFLTKTFSYIFRFTSWLWAFALAGLFLVFWDPAARRHAGFVVGLLMFSCAAVCPGFYFRAHYFVLMLPAVAILIAVAVTSALRLLNARFSSRWLHAIPVIAFAAASVVAIHRNRDFYFKLTPVQASHVCYPVEPFSAAAPVAEYLRQHTSPTDTIMVLGSEPEIYFYAHRHSASGFIYAYSLVEDQAYWPAMQKQMMQEVEANHPAYVVFVNTYYSWGYSPGSSQVISLGHWMDQYVFNGFEEVGVAELPYLEPSYSNGFAEVGAIERADLESLYFWGDEANGHRRPLMEVRVFKRKG
jgi:4-amino-4-deoxy-L-arabinose transferase-like glycosyltransferase